MVIQVEEMIGQGRFTRTLNQKTVEMLDAARADITIKKITYPKFTEVPLYLNSLHAGYLRYGHVVGMSSTEPDQRVSRIEYALRLKPEFFKKYFETKEPTIPYTLQRV